MLHKRRQYTSDVSDGQWKRMVWMFPKRKGAGRPMELSLREVFNAILYVMVTGCQWHNLPNAFPHPKSVYYHFRKWCLDGTWQRINRATGFLERRRVGRFPRPSAGILDSQSVKTNGSGSERGYAGHKKVKGRKMSRCHAVCTALGFAGQSGGSGITPTGMRTAARYPVSRTRGQPHESRQGEMAHEEADHFSCRRRTHHPRGGAPLPGA